MIVCTKCGQQNEGGATFCARCSAFLEWTGERVEEPPAPGPVTPQPASPSRRVPPSPIPVPPDRVVRTTLSNAVQAVDPGSQAVFALEVRNLGPTVDRLTIEVLGDAAAWAEVDPPALNLMPGTSGTAAVRFRPPRNSSVRAGEVSFGVGIRSVEHPGASVVERGVIRITSFSEFEVDLAPRVRRGRRGGSFTVRAANNGNVPISLALAGSDPETTLRFRFRPATVQVEPGATALASVAVSAGGAFLFGSRRSRPFQIAATPANQPRRTLDGTLQQTALIPLWIPATLVLGAAAIGLVVVANPLGGRPLAAASTQAPVTAAPPTQAPPTQAPVTAAPPTPEPPTHAPVTAAPPTPEPPTPEPVAWWQDAFDAAAAQGIDLGPPAAEGTTAENLRYEEFRNGAICERTNGTYAMSDAIWRKWKTLGGGPGPAQDLGYPVSPLLGPDPGHRRQLFDTGAIFWSAESDVHSVSGQVWAWWVELVRRNGGDVGQPAETGLVGSLGYPLGDSSPDGSGGLSIELQDGRLGVDKDGNGWTCSYGLMDGQRVCISILPILPITP